MFSVASVAIFMPFFQSKSVDIAAFSTACAFLPEWVELGKVNRLLRQVGRYDLKPQVKECFHDRMV